VPDGDFDADGVRAVVKRFIDAYEARFGEGSAFEAAGVELTTFRLVASSPTIRPQLRPMEAASPDGASAAGATREVFNRGAWTQARVLSATDVVPGLQVRGLAIVEMPDTTIVVGPGQEAVIDDYGNFVISHPEALLESSSDRETGRRPEEVTR